MTSAIESDRFQSVRNCSDLDDDSRQNIVLAFFRSRISTCGQGIKMLAEVFQS